MAKQHSSEKGKRERRVFPEEFKAKVVELVRRGERPVGEICRELDLTDSAVRNWVKQAEGGRHGGRGSGPGERESEELARLRAEVRQLKMEREILKKATAFFVREFS